jgi:hypothetical protein
MNHIPLIDYIILYIVHNLDYVFFILLLIYLLVTDTRFAPNRKYLFVLFNFIFIIIGIYIYIIPYLIVKDLFWYSLILNECFIFHTLILSRIFLQCWKNHYEFMGFLVSRISFTLLLSVVLYLLLRFISISFKLYHGRYRNYYDYKFFKLFQFILIVLKIIFIYFSHTFHNYSLFILGIDKTQFTLKIILFNLFIFILFLLY